MGSARIETMHLNPNGISTITHPVGDFTSIMYQTDYPNNFSVAAIGGVSGDFTPFGRWASLAGYTLDYVVSFSSGVLVYIENDFTSILGIPVEPNTAYLLNEDNLTVESILRKDCDYTDGTVSSNGQGYKLTRTHFGGTLEDSDIIYAFGANDLVPYKNIVCGTLALSNSLERYEVHVDLDKESTTSKTFPTSIFSSAYNLIIESVEVYAAWYPDDYEGNLGPGISTRLQEDNELLTISDDKITVTLNNTKQEMMNATIVWIL